MEQDEVTAFLTDLFKKSEFLSNCCLLVSLPNPASTACSLMHKFRKMAKMTLSPDIAVLEKIVPREILK
jgi:hypothetical protein